MHRINNNIRNIFVEIIVRNQDTIVPFAATSISPVIKHYPSITITIQIIDGFREFIRISSQASIFSLKDLKFIQTDIPIRIAVFLIDIKLEFTVKFTVLINNRNIR